MATAAARAVQRANALQRLEKMTKKLAKAYGVDPPDFPTHHRDPAYLPTLQMETIADFLDSLSKADSDEEAEATEPEDDTEKTVKPAAKARGKSAAKAKDA